jgi:RNA polymerase sigma factor (sigma-70 family)
MTNQVVRSEETLVVENIPLVVSIAFKYRPKPPNDYDDLIAIGMMGLLKAIRSHNSDRGSLSTIAYLAIKREIERELGKRSRKEQPSNNITDLDVEQDERPDINDYLPDFLTEEDKKVLYMRFHLNSTFDEIGKSLGYTKQWASLKINSLIKKIRESNEKT